ncbi:MAG: hypothetical protein Q9163_001482 [Psora crenata]
MALEVIDLALFISGSNKDREKVASELRNELSRHGFVKITGHGIQEAQVAKLFEWVSSRERPALKGTFAYEECACWQNKAFFKLSGKDKAAIAHPGGSQPQRGWSAVGAENSSKLYQKGLLKSQIAEELKDARCDLEYPNRWPDNNIVPGFRDFMEDTFEKMRQVASLVMEALEVGFGLPPGTFTNRMTNERNSSEFRLLHYPAIDVEEIKRGKVSRIWPHFDLGVITLLFQDSVGGLEFENRNTPGTFDRVDPGNPSELVVNVSETLQRWTNGDMPAGLHRVSLPEGLGDRVTGVVPERYSVAYFCKADRDCSVGPLGQFIHHGIKPRYEDISALEYHQQRLQSAY